MSKAKNAFQVKPPEGALTIGKIRKYLNDMEALWSEEDNKYIGDFENQAIQTLGHSGQGIARAKIIYEGGLDFIIHPLI